MSLAHGADRPAHTAPQRRQAAPYVIVGALVVLVVLACLAALALVQSIDKQISDVRHAYALGAETRELRMALSQAGDNQLAYALTADPVFLDAYRRYAEQSNNRLAALRAATLAHASEAALVERVAEQVVFQLAELERGVSQAGTPVPTQGSAAKVLHATGQNLSLVGAELEELETRLGEQILAGEQAIEQSRLRLIALLLAALLGVLVLAAFIVLRTRQQVRSMAQSQSALADQNEILEARVRERTQALDEARTHAEHERERVEALLRDTSHRIGNSLSTVSSLLGLQLLRTSSDDVRSALEAAHARVHAIAAAHRRLRLGSDLETVSLDAFLGAVLDDLAATVDTAKVRIEGSIAPIVIKSRDATTVGILVGELVTNAIKHGFPGDRSGRISVRVEQDATGVPTLTVSDNGVGMAEDRPFGQEGLGSVIIRQLAAQFGGKPDYQRPPEGGLLVQIPLPHLRP